ncbi:YARHG domain-containing protein [Myroides sp. N17-2]|uniref:YARHG domain-containing protein n=1 Tax=Myroides sp. N17-2 TaxID=2030799 RepID=UPI000EFD5974|nr:YARHG domain-containing protein [Myroides sp. N17-2]
MRKFSLIVIALVLLASCKKDKPVTLETYDDEVPATEEVSAMSDVPDFGNNYGLWSGEFVADEINHENNGVYSRMNMFSIVVKSISNGQVEGYSVSAGNVRPFEGEVVETTSAGQYVVVEEPGDHKYDGIFKFTISPDKSKVEGKWYSNRKDLPVLIRKFSINKKYFSYNPKVMLSEYDEEGNESDTVDWINDREKIKNYDGEEYAESIHRAASDEIYKINGSTRNLSERELKTLRKLDLEIIRNTIYARHGYTFANRGARQFFDSVEWYIPLYANVEGELTDIEKSNIKLLKRLEKYAEDYYQQYGR